MIGYRENNFIERRIRLCLQAAVFLLLTPFLAEASTKDCEMPAQLRFSLVPQGDVKKDLTQLAPLFSKLEQALGVPVKVVFPSSYGAVIEGLLSGAVDLARLGPAAYVSAIKQDPKITAFASFSRKAGTFQQEGAAYYSLLVVRSDSQLQNVDSLRGKKLALVDPDSTSGAMVARHNFSREITGQPLERFFGKVSYTGNHGKSIFSVLNKEVDAAFVSSSHLSDFVSKDKMKKDDVMILWRSTLIPRDPFVYRGQLCGHIKEKIAAVFLSADGKNNKALLNNLNAVGFVPVSDGDYQIIRDLY